MIDVDRFDLKILAALQEDASLTNQQIGERIGLSASQISRRRQRLETTGVIRRYRADVDGASIGVMVTAFIGVALATHNRQNAQRFREMVRVMPAVQEAYAMTGDMDYLLKIATADLKSLSVLINDELLPHEAVQNLRSSIVLERLKDDNRLPLL